MERRPKRILIMSGSSSLARKIFTLIKFTSLVVFIVTVFVNVSLSTIGSKFKRSKDLGEIGPAFVRSFSDISNSELLRFVLTNGTGDISDNGKDVAVEILEPFIERLSLAEEKERQRGDTILNNNNNKNKNSNNNNNNKDSSNILNNSNKNEGNILKNRQKTNDNRFVSLLLKNMRKNAIVKPLSLADPESNNEQHETIDAGVRSGKIERPLKLSGNEIEIKSTKVKESKGHIPEETSSILGTITLSEHSNMDKEKATQDQNAKTFKDKSNRKVTANLEKRDDSNDNNENTNIQSDENHLKNLNSDKTIQPKKEYNVKVNNIGRKEGITSGQQGVKQKVSIPAVVSKTGEGIHQNKDHPAETRKDNSISASGIKKLGAKDDRHLSSPKETKMASGASPKTLKAGQRVNGSVELRHNSHGDQNVQTGEVNKQPVIVRGMKAPEKNGRERPVEIGVRIKRPDTGEDKERAVAAYTSVRKQEVAKKIPSCNETKLPLVGRLAVQKVVYGLPQLKKLIPDVDIGGHFRPLSCRPKEKTAIIIPYRNREQHLALLLLNIYPVLKRQGIDFTIFVIDENLPTPFNRGMLLNIGFLEANKLSPFDCFIFHDVDLIPLDDRNTYECHAQGPIHFLTGVNVFKYSLSYANLFGGVTAFTTSQYHMINGASNLYFGWGGEDDDLRKRSVKKGYSIFRKKHKIGMYDMLSHTGDKTNNKNPVRRALLKKSLERQDSEGLNSALYHVISIDKYALYTRISVSINFTQVLGTAPNDLHNEMVALKGSFAATATPQPAKP